MDMMFNATFNNVSVTLLQSVFFVEETGVLGENQWQVASHWQTLSRNVVSNTPRHEQDSYQKTLVVVGTDCTGTCSWYHTISTTTDPGINGKLMIHLI
jgi:hypothetical protein